MGYPIMYVLYASGIQSCASSPSQVLRCVRGLRQVHAIVLVPCRPEWGWSRLAEFGFGALAPAGTFVGLDLGRGFRKCSTLVLTSHPVGWLLRVPFGHSPQRPGGGGGSSADNVRGFPLPNTRVAPQGGVLAQRGHSAGTGPIITVFIPGTPPHTTPLQKRA